MLLWQINIVVVVEIIIGTYTGPTQQCHFEWPWVT